MFAVTAETTSAHGMKKALFIAIVPFMDTESAMLNALNVGADDGRKTANGMKKGKAMIDFLKKKFNFAKGGFITGESIRVELENNEWIVPMETMKLIMMNARIAKTKSFRFRFRNLVAVTHCKDCKWWGKAGCAISIVDASDRPKENDFCSFAERKDNG